MTPSCHPSHVASQAKAEKTPCHKHTQALSHTHRHVHPHTCAHRHLCAYVFACAHVGTDVRRRTGARPRTSTHALRQRPGTQGQEPQQADLGPCPCSRPHWPSLCQSRPGGQDPWRVGGSVGERGGTRPGWRLCLWDTAPPTSEIHTWALLPGLWCSLLDGPCSPAASPRAALPHPPRRAEVPASASPPASTAPPTPQLSAQRRHVQSAPEPPRPKPGATFGFGSRGVTWLLLMCLWAAQPWNGDPRLQRGAGDHRVTNVGMDARTHRGQARVLREHGAGRGWGWGGRGRSRKARQVGRGCGPQEA